MEIVRSQGCTAYYTRVDGKDISELTNDKLRQLATVLFEKFYMSNEFGMFNFIENTLSDFGEYESDPDPCDQCGDYVSRTILNID